MNEGGWIWQVFVSECARTQHPQRIGDIRLACARADSARAQRLPPRAVERLLDERARTGKARILGLVAGLRSGGRRLYWPAGSELPSQDITAPSLIELTLRELRAHPQWANGEPFQARALVDWLRLQVTSNVPITWHGVYAALRNLARRNQPVVQTRHEANGRTIWALRPESNPEATSNVSSLDVAQLIAAHVERSGCTAVPLNELLVALGPNERGEVRRVLHHLKSARNRVTAAGTVLSYVSVGRFQGIPVLTLTDELEIARQALSARSAAQTLRTIRWRLRHTNLMGTGLRALSTRERLSGWLPELRATLCAAQTHAHGVWANTLASQVEYCSALTEWVSNLREQHPCAARCLEITPASWICTATSVGVLKAFAGAPNSRQAFRPLLSRWQVLHRHIGPVPSGGEQFRDPARFDAVDVYLLAHAHLGSPTDRSQALASSHAVGIGRPDLSDVLWEGYIQPHERSGLEFYHRALDAMPREGRG